MEKGTSERLRSKSDRIIKLWIEQVEKDISSAHRQPSFIIKNAIPEFLDQIADALSANIERTQARVKSDEVDIKGTGAEHGASRANIKEYTIDQLILEYHILRKVIFQVLEESTPLKLNEIEIIVCAVERAVNDAATEFSKTLDIVRESLSATLVHDLRSPITTAKLHLELLLLQSTDALAKKAATQVLKCMDRLSSMIHELLDASALRAGEKVSIQIEECDLEEIASQVVAQFNDVTPATPFIFKSTGPILGRWSEDGLRRTVENLASNACKYGTPNTPVIIEVKQDSNLAQLTVHNEGEPIPNEERDNIFQEFHRLRAFEKPGWGLGLSLVKGIVEAHHGNIRVESSKEKGTSFIIQIPKNLEEKATKVQSPSTKLAL